ncbi:MAG: hypothetical protein MUF43_05235 [Flavobacterium sp.]|jgi:hypothetical protein|nr:hypothetical protein [Flavobacterium sp.]
MKKIIPIVVLIFIFSCQGSDTYQGKWKVMDAKGNKLFIEFQTNDFSIYDSLGKNKNYSYTQNSIKYENSIKTYGITLEDGRAYKISFPTNDKNVAIILNEDDVKLFSLHRNRHQSFEEIYSLY